MNENRNLKGTLHSKLAIDFLAGLKVYIFGKFLQRKGSRLMPSLLRYFRPKCAERCRSNSGQMMHDEFQQLWIALQELQGQMSSLSQHSSGQLTVPLTEVQSPTQLYTGC